MKKQQLNCNAGLRGAAVYKIVAAVVFFSIFANIVNLGIFYRGNAVELNSFILQAGTQLSKVINKVNMPVKITGDLFKFTKSANGAKTDDSKNNDKAAVIVKHSDKINTELRKRNICLPANTLKILHIEPVDTGQSGCSPGYLFLYSNFFIMTLLLILLLMSVLPRGIPLRKIKNINIFLSPVFMSN